MNRVGLKIMIYSRPGVG